MPEFYLCLHSLSVSWMLRLSIISIRATRSCAHDQWRNHKLIHMTSSNKRQEQMCVDLSEYERYLNQIWYNACHSSTRRSNARMFRFYLPQKSMTAVTAILNFRKCQYFQILWRCVHQIWWEDESQHIESTDQVTKNRNWKLIQMM